MPKRKNLIVFYVDQQHRDCLGCYGNAVARTPNIDALAGRGMLFRHHYASNTICMPSRASFFTGQHVQSHRLLTNGVPLGRDAVTLPGTLAEHGFRTEAIGKIHLTPFQGPERYGFEESTESWHAGRWDGWTGPYFGFDKAQLVIGHSDAAFASGGHYGQWMQEHHGPTDGLTGRLRRARDATPFRSPLPLEAYHSTWVGDRAVDAVSRLGAEDRPFFLYVSFPDPHHPFTPPEPYASMFEGCDFPAPHARPGENETKPRHYLAAERGDDTPRDGKHDWWCWDAETWNKVWAATYGMNALIDHSVGRVMDALALAGLEDSTVVAYTADHGDLLGDHHLMYKGPYPCRSLLNVPFVVADPDGTPGESDVVMSNVDAMPTFLDLLGAPIPDSVQGRSYRGVLEGAGEPDEPFALACGWPRPNAPQSYQALYEGGLRVAYFPTLDDGELYDLAADPYELDNLYHHPSCQALRDEMLAKLCRRVGRAEPEHVPMVALW